MAKKTSFSDKYAADIGLVALVIYVLVLIIATLREFGLF